MIQATGRYRLYGLTLETSVPLPCARISRGGEPDVSLRAGDAHEFDAARRDLRLPRTPRDWFECRRLPDGTTYLRWQKLFEFLISSDGRVITFHRLAHATDESLTTYLLGQVLSFSLVSFKREPLHATAIVIGGEAVGFLGDCGYGKSTIGAAFISRGFHLLTDDVLAIEPRNGVWMAHAGPPRLKVFPSVSKRVLARRGVTRLNSGTSKLVLKLSADEACGTPVPLTALYVLGEPARKKGPEPSRVELLPLRGADAFLEITRAAFNVIQTDRARLANHFELASRVANEIPVRRLVYPRRIRRLSDVCDAVIADAVTLKRPRSRTGTAD